MYFQTEDERIVSEKLRQLPPVYWKEVIDFIKLVITNLKGKDLILYQITSKNVKDEYAIEITEKDFDEGSLRQVSNIRPNKIFTADEYNFI